MGLSSRIPGDHKFVRVPFIDGQSVREAVEAAVALGTIQMSSTRWFSEVLAIAFIPDSGGSIDIDDGVNTFKLQLPTAGGPFELVSGRAHESRLYNAGSQFTTMIIYSDSDR